ncbi:MAG: carotenoid oxygenase family protein [Myxococcota bacterium]|nr:carotenoid oxygenase family protein [Myxococcota bacterium]
MSWDQIVTASPQDHECNLPISGALPPALSGGSYYLNGPGRLGEFGIRLHPFDGHGLLRALRFSEGGVSFKSRFVETESLRRERRAERGGYRGIGGLTNESKFKNWRAKKKKNTANTCVRAWQGKLLCGYEGGWPHRVDPAELETEGLESFGGTLIKDLGFLAHTRYDATTGELFGVSLKPGKHSQFCVHGYGADGLPTLRQEWRQFGMTLIHDFLITKHYVVLIENPIIPEIPVLIRALSGLAAIMEALKQQDRPARLFLFPRAGGEPRVIEFDKSYIGFHHAAASERLNEAGEVVGLTLYSCLFEQYIDFGREFGYQGHSEPYADGFSPEQPPQRLSRIDVDLERDTARATPVSDWALDFPIIHPEGDGRGCTHVYGAAATPAGTFAPFDTLCRVDVESGESIHWRSDRGYIGEPCFIPSGADEEAGYLLAMAYRPEATELLVFEAERLDKGPVATAPLPEAFPYGFHGSFVTD